MNDPIDPKEEKALDALISAALYPFESTAEVSEAEAQAFIEERRPLTKSEEDAIARISDDPSGWAGNEPPDATWATAAAQHELAAMHREKVDEDLDAATVAEIERKRAEIREKLKRRRRPG